MAEDDLWQVWRRFSDETKRSFVISGLSELTMEDPSLRAKHVPAVTIEDILRAIDKVWK